DTKLLAAVGLWAGPDLAATFLIATAFAGAVIGVAWLTPVRRLMPAAPLEDEAGSVEPGTGFRARLKQPVPYGVAIALGGLHLAALRAFH
ncbi:MAG TPA: hypothetical protein VK433_07240, partial [Stellaceae bacterium]|nr:hypothetical protein [Stellaceae bacterium]